MQDRFGASYLEPRIPKGTPRREKFRMHLRAPLVSVHYALIAANALIITGSSYMVGAMDQEDPRHESKLDKAKGLREYPHLPFQCAAKLTALENRRRRWHGRLPRNRASAPCGLPTHVAQAP